MNRTVLHSNGIYYDEDPAKAADLPPHAASLRVALLDFACTIADKLGCGTDDELVHASSTIFSFDAVLSNYERLEISQTLKRIMELKEQAERLHRGRDREAEWEDYYGGSFFKPLVEAATVNDDQKRQFSRACFYYDCFESAKRRPWTLFKKGSRHRRDYPGLTCPSPDWVAYLPIYDSAARFRVKDSPKWRWWNLPKHAMYENFSRNTLQHLASRGLEPSTAGVFHSNLSDEISLSDYLCFPWLIVEHKKLEHNSIAHFCYCQAANAAMAALTILQTLSQYATRRPQNSHIPPIATVTTVGHEVRAWVMYVRDDGLTYEMKCIWLGYMTTAIDIMRFQALLENCHTWAMRVLRPWISSYIDQWRFEHSHEGHVLSEPRADQSPIVESLAGEISALVFASAARPELNPSNEYEEAGNKVDFRELLKEEHGNLFKALKSLIETSIQVPPVTQQDVRPVIATRSVSTQTAEPYISESEVVQKLPRIIFDKTHRFGNLLSDSLNRRAAATTTRRDSGDTLYTTGKKFWWNGKMVLVKLPMPHQHHARDASSKLDGTLQDPDGNNNTENLALHERGSSTSLSTHDKACTLSQNTEGIMDSNSFTSVTTQCTETDSKKRPSNSLSSVVHKGLEGPSLPEAEDTTSHSTPARAINTGAEVNGQQDTSKPSSRSLPFDPGTYDNVHFYF